MAYPGLPNGGNSMTTPGGATPQASASAAAFARKKLMAAQAAGLLPGNFNIAHTRQNLLGQFHMLNGGIQHAAHNGGATPDNQSAIMQLIGGLGQNNLVTRGQQDQYGPGTQLPNGGNSMTGVGAPGMQQGDMQNQLLQMLLGNLMGSGFTGFTQPQAPGFYDPSNPTLY